VLSALGTASIELCKFIAFCKAAQICKNLKDAENLQKINKKERTCLKENCKYRNVAQLTNLLVRLCQKAINEHHWSNIGFLYCKGAREPFQPMAAVLDARNLL